MIEAITYNDLLKDLNMKYKGKCKTFGILLVRPNKSDASNEILNDIQYFHHRSSNNLDIYMPGYGAYWGDEIPDSINICKINDVQWSFSNKKFTEFVESFEFYSKWKYRGEIELLLLDFERDNISFKEVVRVKINIALRDRAIDSATTFIENIISIFKNSKTNFEASDTLTLKGLGKSISDELTRKSVVFRLFKRTRHFTIYNYEKRGEKNDY